MPPRQTAAQKHERGTGTNWCKKSFNLSAIRRRCQHTRRAGLSTPAVCRHCSSVIDISSEQLHIMAVAEQPSAGNPLALGSRGTLPGHAWKSSASWSTATQQKYILGASICCFQPVAGLPLPGGDQGHWSFVAGLRRSLDTSGLPSYGMQAAITACSVPPPMPRCCM